MCVCAALAAGPKRQWMFMSRVRFFDRHIADTHQYLVVSYRDGRKEHKWVALLCAVLSVGCASLVSVLGCALTTVCVGVR